MEMHQVRYFLAVTRTLNFTRAAEECNVAQPSLTRAIKLLEDELGGDLFRRERNLSHLTDLGQRMMPLLQQCYDSALNAKSLASSLKSGKIAPLSIALSRTIGMDLLVPHLGELMRAFKSLELKFTRGTADVVAEALKKGEVDVAVAGRFSDDWDRFDSWPLFTEPYSLFVSSAHPLAGSNVVEVKKLAEVRLLVRSYCEQEGELSRLMDAQGASGTIRHKVANEADLGALLDGNVGVAIAPRSMLTTAGTRRVHLEGIDLQRTAFVYAVAGRPRSPAAATLIKLLRAADWSEIER